MQTKTSPKGKQVVVITVAAGLVLMLMFSFMSKSHQPVQRAQSRPVGSQSAGPSMNAEQSSKIQTYMEQLKNNPDNTEALNGLGELFMSMGSLEKSAFFWNRLLKITPEDESALYHYGIVLLKLDKTMQSVDQFEKIVKLNPENYHACYYLGMILRNDLNQKERGAKYLRKILEINPDHKELIDIVRKELAKG
ncbi:tetratricopeptide repeat protein [Maridesulfovibrio ferrireducens]|uniref:tetratricopeptide repeat protein n=1 Tax=Maridesulfovibrio ferrireducens TaxID=246191 RepID=UPI001A1B8A53|nr:tetratricopeptide repeat protein [Maridesulfovibrio ferrireducens]MBI9111915.1 tetratricopeptide repeat protein [Maridesulfovibrio ferrireducens]